MANWINAKGHAVVGPRFVAVYVNNHFGRRVRVRDNFPHLDGGDSASPTDVLCIDLGPNDPVVPALKGAGYRLTGPWKMRSDRSAVASASR